MKIRSIYSKFMFSMFLIIVVFSISILGAIRQKVATTYESEVMKSTSNTCSSIASLVGSFMDKAYAITELMATSEEMSSMEQEKQLPIIENAAKQNDYFELIYVQDSNGDQTARSVGELGNRSSRWWFIQSMQDQVPFVSKSYYSISTNMTCASIFYPIFNNNEMIGIFATDLKLSTLQSLVENYSDIEEDKICFIIDGEGNVLAHPNSTYFEELYNYKTLTRTVSKTNSKGETLKDSDGNILTEDFDIEVTPEYQKMIDDVMKGNSGTTLVKDNGITYYACYEPIPMKGISDSWSVITLTGKDKALSLVAQIKATGNRITFLALIIALILIALIAASIIRPIRMSLNRLKLLSEGDLSSTVPNVQSHDESAELLANLNITIRTMKDIINQITSFSNQIADGNFLSQTQSSYSGEFNQLAISLNQICESMQRTMQEIKLYTEQFMKGTMFFNDAAKTLSDGTSNQAAAIEEVSASLCDISEHFNQNAIHAQSANNMMSSVMQEITDNHQCLNQLVNAMNSIEENSQNIKMISHTIQSIATQTRILSLNATVEAARAGAAGKSFSVIVDEIQALALRCEEAANNTEQLISMTNQSIHEGMEQLNSTVASMNSVSKQNTTVASLLSDISNAVSEQAASMEQIQQAVEQISDITQLNAQTAEKNAEKSSDMQAFVQQLNLLLARFRF